MIGSARAESRAESRAGSRWNPHARVVALWMTLFALGGCPERGKGKTGEETRGAPTSEGAREGEEQASASTPSVPTMSLAREPEGPADPDAVIGVRLEAEPAHLNPLLSADAITVRVALGDILEGLLCQRHPTALAEPCLARSVHENRAGTVFTFALRSGVRWHDGAAFSADDVIFTYQLLTGVGASRPGEEATTMTTTTTAKAKAKGEALVSWLGGEFDDLVRLERRDEATVVMTFAGFRMGRREAFARVPILPRHVFGRYAPGALHAAPENRAPVGTGPLVLEAWRSGQGMTLERFADYWGEAAGAARIEYRVLPSRARVFRAMASGTLDVALRIPVDQAMNAADEIAGVRPFVQRTASYLAAVYNLRDGPLAQVELRRALTRMMDRQTLSRVLFSGHARVISGPYLASDPDRHPDIEPLAFDGEAALDDLARTGDDQSPLILEVLVPAESKSMRRLADIWAEDVSRTTRGSRARHVRLEIVTAPFVDVLTRLREGDFEVALMAFTTGLELDLHARFATGAPENYGGLADAELTRALEAVRAEPDARARRALQWRVQERLHELMPYTFITDGVEVGLVRDQVGGFAQASAGARALWRAR